MFDHKTYAQPSLKHRKWVYQVTSTGRGANNLTTYSSWNILKLSKSPLKNRPNPIGIFRCFNSLFGSGSVYFMALRATWAGTHHDLGSEGFSSKLNIVEMVGVEMGMSTIGGTFHMKTASFHWTMIIREKVVRPNMTHQIQVCSGQKKGVHVEVSDVICFEKAVILWRDLRAPASQKKKGTLEIPAVFWCFATGNASLFFVTDCQRFLVTFVSTQLGCITDRDP